MSKPQMHSSFLPVLVAAAVVLYYHDPPSLIISVVATAGSFPDTKYYHPTESLAINCGSSANSSSLDNRTWIGDDTPSNLFTIINHPTAGITNDNNNNDKHNTTSSSSVVANNAPISSDPVPYSTARIYRGQFSYIFHVTPGPKFLRLHFSAVAYPGFEDTSAALFSVTANAYTLLSNFSVLLAVEYLQDQLHTSPQQVFREFVLFVSQHDRMEINLTFTPSSGRTPEAYAFVNGIEIVSMPTHLYYSTADNGNHQGNKDSEVKNNTALETMYRLNVGGGLLSPSSDTGMYRTWAGDGAYMPVSHDGPVNALVQLEFTDQTPPYVAPADLYRSARSFGPNDPSDNITWVLPVDVDFWYVLRLHFCEIEQYVTKTNDRVFRIYINNEEVEDHADVISWSDGLQSSRTPVYRDYGVYVAKMDDHNLTVTLRPNPYVGSTYRNVILNGLEVFKKSNNNASLAAPNPNPSLPSSSNPSLVKEPSNKKQQSIVVAAVISCCAALALVCLLSFLVRRRSKQVLGGTHPNRYSDSTPLPAGLCRHFSLSEITAATNNFDRVSIIGRGGFGDVYKGHIDIDGGVLTEAVAIKRLKAESKQGFQEFKTEIEMLSQLRHIHLVSLIGYCNDDGEMILVYAYVSRGALRDYLYNTRTKTKTETETETETETKTAPSPHPLPWKQRLLICLGAARGLHHLHRGGNHKIIHRDVKTSNILLDDNWVAKVSDFGLSRVGGPNNGGVDHDDHVSTMVKGSLGYLDPEYFRSQQLTEKSDVYSFGVVLLEVLCGRPPVNQALPRDEVSLAVCAKINYKKGTLHQIVDPHLDGQISSQCLRKYGEIAISCLSEEGTQRPPMGDVVGALEFVLRLQQDEEELGIKLEGECSNGIVSTIGSNNGGRVSGRVMMPSSSLSDSSALMVATSTSADSERLVSSEGSVFSEIMNRDGR